MNALSIISPVDLHSILIRNDVSYMSDHLLGLPYVDLKALIYPAPQYKTFTITKRSGTLRIIHEPRRKLKELQEKLLAYLYAHAGTAKPCVHGFTPKRSIVTNAKMHCSPKTQHLLNIDLENFFPSITFYRVRGLLQNKPFGFSYHVATVLAQLCTYNGRLPQGAPTSPLLANLTCRSLDRDLMKLAKRHRAIYSRYADDITFSFSVRRSENLPGNICSFDGGVLTLGEELCAIITSHSFQVNQKKSRLSSRQHRIEVTGITINEFPNVKRVFVDRIRGALHAWDIYGYESAQAFWVKKVGDTGNQPYDKRLWRRQTRTGDVPSLKNVLWGKLLYLRMVRGADDILYSRLADQYNGLCARENENKPFGYPSLPVDAVVRTHADAEDAVYVIEWMGDYRMPGSPQKIEMVGGQGTAFAYKDVGLITCNHVLTFSGTILGKHVDTDCQSSDVVNLVLSVTNPVTGQMWPVSVLHRDAGRDLACLKFAQPVPPTHHYFASMNQPIPIHATGILIGFPNHSAGKRANFLKERVLNCFNRSALKRIEIAASIRQGNSGGPFVDEMFRVAGVAQQGARQDYGNDECLCFTELDYWLSTLKLNQSSSDDDNSQLAFAATTVQSAEPNPVENKCGQEIGESIAICPQQIGNGISTKLKKHVIDAYIWLIERFSH